MHRRYLLGLFGGFAFIFAGCGVRQYRRVPLPVVSKNDAHWSGEKDGVCMNLRVVPNRELETVLSGRSFATHKKVRAILLTISNTIGESVELDQEHLGLKVLSIEDAYNMLAYPIGPCVAQTGVGVALGIGAIIGAPIGIFCCIASFAFPVALVWAVPWAVCAVGAPVIIGHSIHMSGDIKQFNRELFADLNKKMRMSMVIEPSREKTCILFTDQLHERFVITIRAQMSGRLIPFDVDISSCAENVSH